MCGLLRLTPQEQQTLALQTLIHTVLKRFMSLVIIDDY